MTRNGRARASAPTPRRGLSLVTEDPNEPTASLVERAQSAERAGRRDEARALYERALHSRHDPPDAALATSLFRWIGSTYRIDANYDAALDCIEVALAVAEATGNHGAVGHATNLRAIVRWQLGDLDAAERQYNEARASALRAGDARLAAMIAQNLGVIANIRGDLDEALRYYETSLADYRALGLAGDVCVALNNLGKLHTDTGRWAEAQLAYAEALQISAALGDLPSQILLHVNVAELCVAQSRYDDAGVACDRALDVTRRSTDESALGEIFRLYGIIARETGQLADAERRFLEAERIAIDRQEALLRAQTARELAMVYRELGRNRDTLQCLNRSHALFSQLRARRDLADIASRMTLLEGEFLEVVRRWGESIESKDRYTQGHCVRVADLACALAHRTGMDGQTLFWFRIGALLHDVGKLVIPAEVLNKPGRLNEDEWALIRRHPIAGVEMVSEIEFPWDIRPIIEQHHECWDGSGYPHRLRGEEIAVTARILGIADVYDALTSERSYKKALPHEEALGIMRRDVGRQFDPALFRVFEELVQETDDPAIARLLTPRTLPPTPPAPPAVEQVGLDELTDLPLRRAFVERAQSALGARSATNGDLSLLIIDIDRFKLINDTFGHLQGDDVLRSVASTLRSELRSSDVVARYGGDEFVILLSQTPPAAAADTAERVRRAVESSQVRARDGGGMVTVTVSIGIASTPTYGESVEALFAAADRALYTAKARGRNTVAVAGEPTSETTPQLRLERFVGRTKELRSLVRHLDGATRGDPRVVAIVGEAGIGKTALVRQLEPEARLRAGSFVIGRCCEADVKPPYGPWADVLESLRALGIAPECAWRELPRIVRSLAPAGDVTETAVSKYAIFDEITQFLKLAAAVRPLTIVLDDMQWADSATWDVLEHLLLHLAQDRILVCLTIRTEDAATIAPRQRRLSRDDRYHELRVPRLSANDLRQWMEAVFHQGDLDNELPAFVDRYTEGNPLVIVQVLRSLADEGAVWYAGTRWEWRPVAEIRLPVGVRDLLSRRLAHLSPKARHILGAAAVLGRTFEVDTALEAGGCTEDDLLDAIDEGVTAHVIARVANLTEDRYSFTHGLLAEAVRATVNPRRLRRIHARVARTMARRTPDSHAEIAAHYASADCGDEAFRHAMLGARHAMAMYAGEDARSFIELALRYATSRTQRLEGYTLAIQVAEIMGRYAEGEQHCNVILADATTPAEQRLPIERARERLRALQGTPPRDTLVTCSGLLAQAEQQRNATERVQLLNMLAVVHGRLGDWGSAQRLARESVTAARALGDERLHADALLRLGSGLLESSPALALCEYERALELYARLDDRYGQARSYINMGVAQSRDGNLDAAEESYARALALGQPAHAPDLAGLATLNLGVLYVRRGRFDEAAGRFNEALRLFETVKSEIHRLAARYNLARLELECDRPRNALPLFIDVVTLAVQLGVEDVEIGARAGVGLSFLALGDMSAGGRALAEASAPLSNRRDWWFQGRELVEALTVRAALAAGDVARAASAFADGVARAEEWDPYAALWLVAECAPDLTRHGRPESDAAITRLASAAARLRFGPVVERFSALVAQREQRPGAASA